MRAHAASRQAAASRGRRAVLVLRVVTIGTVGAMLLWVIPAIFAEEPANMPTWIWVLAVLVAPAALFIAWDPAARVDDLVWTTFCAACVLGFFGFYWGSHAAPAIGLGTIIAMAFMPKPRGRQRRST